ncbi:hypothetical protein WICPIJ_002168 [Wickerhamomyces pijperi]|uniref:Uncharacterized protein n=1 Tax=Wickerhamomyces pijperi TaxID=599730 RepID=A0A9P8TQF5_WICPI|nr:hypothetical protein WICPIJ_002168 [Wickerhamomyces pijperi]
MKGLEIKSNKVLSTLLTGLDSLGYSLTKHNGIANVPMANVKEKLSTNREAKTMVGDNRHSDQDVMSVCWQQRIAQGDSQSTSNNGNKEQSCVWCKLQQIVDFKPRVQHLI